MFDAEVGTGDFLSAIIKFGFIMKGANFWYTPQKRRSFYKLDTNPVAQTSSLRAQNGTQNTDFKLQKSPTALAFPDPPNSSFKRRHVLTPVVQYKYQ